MELDVNVLGFSVGQAWALWSVGLLSLSFWPASVLLRDPSFYHHGRHVAVLNGSICVVRGCVFFLSQKSPVVILFGFKWMLWKQVARDSGGRLELWEWDAAGPRTPLPAVVELLLDHVRNSRSLARVELECGTTQHGPLGCCSVCNCVLACVRIDWIIFK